MTGFLSQVWVRAGGRRVLLVTAMAVSLRKTPAIIVLNLRASMMRSNMFLLRCSSMGSEEYGSFQMIGVAASTWTITWPMSG